MIAAANGPDDERKMATKDRLVAAVAALVVEVAKVRGSDHVGGGVDNDDGDDDGDGDGDGGVCRCRCIQRPYTHRDATKPADDGCALLERG